MPKREEVRRVRGSWAWFDQPDGRSFAAIRPKMSRPSTLPPATRRPRSWAITDRVWGVDSGIFNQIPARTAGSSDGHTGGNRSENHDHGTSSRVSSWAPMNPHDRLGSITSQCACSILQVIRTMIHPGATDFTWNGVPPVLEAALKQHAKVQGVESSARHGTVCSIASSIR